MPLLPLNLDLPLEHRQFESRGCQILRQLFQLFLLSLFLLFVSFQVGEELLLNLNHLLLLIFLYSLETGLFFMLLEKAFLLSLTLKPLQFLLLS